VSSCLHFPAPQSRDNKLYVKLLRQIAGQQADAVAQIRRVLTTNDVESATRLAHTLKEWRAISVPGKCKMQPLP
jgi:hypothetical protein